MDRLFVQYSTGALSSTVANNWTIYILVVIHHELPFRSIDLGEALDIFPIDSFRRISKTARRDIVLFNDGTDASHLARG